jgi:hypothetical protein
VVAVSLHFKRIFRLSVGLTTTFHGVDRLGRFMVRSIAYDPRTRTMEGFFWTGPGPGGRGLKSRGGSPGVTNAF